MALGLIGRILGRIFGRGKRPGLGAPTRLAPPARGQYPGTALAKGRAPFTPPASGQYPGTSASRPPVPLADEVPLALELSHNEEVLASGAKVALASSWQENLWWDWRTKTTYLETKSGGIYAYQTPIEVAVRWVEASSPGRYWWSHIVPYYSPARRVRAGFRRGRQQPNVVRIVRSP